MSKLMWLVGTAAGGWLGWWVGSLVGTFTAFMVSIIGTALGVYWARWVIANHF